MSRLLLLVAMTVSSGWALAVAPTVNCPGCNSLRDFGNFGAAQIFRATGTLSATVGNDRIWVVNPETARKAFVDLDTPFNTFYFIGFPIVVPDYTQTEINATWVDGSASATWILPIEVVVAIGESIELAESDATPEVTVEELPQLPGFDDAYVWQFIGTSGGLSPTILVFDIWSFTVLNEFGFAVPIVTIFECAWSTSC